MVLLCTDHPEVFLNGFDPAMVMAIHTPEQAEAVLRSFLSLINALHTLEPLTIAVITGSCLDEGLELALACRVRVAFEGSAARLGIVSRFRCVPATFAGHQLPKIVGPSSAMTSLITPLLLTVLGASAYGLVDLVFKKDLKLNPHPPPTPDGPDSKQPPEETELSRIRAIVLDFGVRQFKQGIRRPIRPLGFQPSLIHLSHVARYLWWRAKHKPPPHPEWRHRLFFDTFSNMIMSYNQPPALQADVAVRLAVPHLTSPLSKVAACMFKKQDQVRDQVLRSYPSPTDAPGLRSEALLGFVTKKSHVEMLVLVAAEMGKKICLFISEEQVDVAALRKTIHDQVRDAMMSRGSRPEVVKNILAGVSVVKSLEELSQCEAVFELTTNLSAQAKNALVKKLDTILRGAEQGPTTPQPLILSSVLGHDPKLVLAGVKTAVCVDMGIVSRCVEVLTSETSKANVCKAVALLRHLQFFTTVSPHSVSLHLATALIGHTLAAFFSPPPADLKANQAVSEVHRALVNINGACSLFLLDGFAREGGPDLVLPDPAVNKHPLVRLAISNHGLFSPDKNAMATAPPLSSAAEELLKAGGGGEAWEATTKGEMVRRSQLVLGGLVREAERLVRGGITREAVDVIAEIRLQGCLAMAGGLLSYADLVRSKQIDHPAALAVMGEPQSQTPWFKDSEQVGEVMRQHKAVCVIDFGPRVTRGVLVELGLLLIVVVVAVLVLVFDAR
eukprot:c20646_g1_i1.p1 GENE.c20646_g1_i1~~c20646_g1_i1.p1  ORF type:complete len:834 (+),score=191.01 c20646_g1_i1:320-2503(+)